MFHRVETAAGPRMWILLLLIASLSVAPAISQTVEIADLELSQSPESSELELIADGPLVWTQYRDADSNLVIELPNTVVGEAMGQLESADGLVSAVELMTVENGERPLTRLVVQTRAEAEHTLTVDGSVLHLSFSPPATVAELESQTPSEAAAFEESELPVEAEEVSSEPLLEDSPVVASAPGPASEESGLASTPAFESTSTSFDTLGTPDDPYYAPPPLGVVATRLDGVVVEDRDSTSVLRILGDGEFDYSTFWLEDPPRFVVDLEGVVNVSHQNSIIVGTSEVDQVRLAQFQSSPDAISRVVFDLGSSLAVPVVRRGPDGLTIRFGDEPSEEAAVVADTVAEEQLPSEESTWQEPVAEDESVETASSELEPMAEPSTEDAMESSVPAEAEIDLASEPAIPGLDEPAIVEEEPVVAETSVREAPARETGSVELFEAQEVTIDTPQTRQEPNEPDFGVRNVGREKQYYGEPISMSLKDADITEVLRSIARLSNLNIVIQPGVSGPVTVELDRVPWDQALEQILKINNLGMQLEGNILRIAPVTQLQQEARAEQELQIARALSVPLRTVMRRINYARAQDIARILTTAQANRGGGAAAGGRGAGMGFNPGGILSPRGNVSVDQRTNTLIIQELPDYLDTVIQIIENLDIPERQVMIEARIIETTRNFTRSLGIEWGFLGISSAQTGNTTGLQFPNNGTAEGGVNLLTGGDNGFLDISMGNILNTFNLDITLQAAENEGLVNVISAPKVATLNNEQASIQTGLQIPIQTVANNTVTVQFVNATLRLDVTPQITADGTISMDINIQKREPLLAFAIVGATNAPIATREARTRVLVRDGGTAVIGGIYEVSNNDQEGRVPGIANVPVLGALFKNKDKSNQNEELLIFITPRVIQL